MGLVKKILKFPSESERVCLMALSPIGSRINAINNGGRGKLCRLRKYPSNPNTPITPTSKKTRVHPICSNAA